MKLTPRESDLLALVSLYADVHGRAPMQEHVAAGMGHSRQRTQQLLKQLEAKGRIKLTTYKIRGIEVVGAE
jgi:SOS-response transcriptional repressor LexA